MSGSDDAALDRKAGAGRVARDPQPGARRKTIPIILDQYVEDAASLWTLRTALASAPHVTLDHLARFDDRLDANLHGIAIAGPDGVRACTEQLVKPGPGELFVATTCAIRRNDRALLDRLFAITAAVPHTTHGLWSALGWAAPGQLSGLVVEWLEAPDPARIVAAVVACGMHRVDPGDRLAALAGHDDAPVRARVMRTIGELALARHRPVLDIALDTADPETVPEAARAAVLLGDRGRALDRLESFCVSVGPMRFRAWEVALPALDPGRANAVLRTVAADGERMRDLVIGAGLAGDARYLPWLIERMNDDSVARVAAESFAMMTGLDMIEGDYARDDVPVSSDAPTDDPADPRVAMDPDHHVPWPDARKVAQWWAANASRFAPGDRCLLGGRADPARLDRALRTAYQRQRRAAAVHQVLGQRKRLFDVRSAARSQRRGLSQS